MSSNFTIEYYPLPAGVLLYFQCITFRCNTQHLIVSRYYARGRTRRAIPLMVRRKLKLTAADYTNTIYNNLSEEIFDAVRVTKQTRNRNLIQGNTE